jgi:hypothetical protein
LGIGQFAGEGAVEVGFATDEFGNFEGELGNFFAQFFFADGSLVSAEGKFSVR